MNIEDAISHTRKRVPLKIAISILCFVLLINSTLVIAQLQGSETISSYGTISYMTPLHIEGRHIKDEFGNTVLLRGVLKHGFEDDPEGRWKDLSMTYFNQFHEDVVRSNFQEIRSWGANEIRVIERAQYWLQDTSGGTGKNNRECIKRLIEIAMEEGLYVVFCLFSMDQSAGYHYVPWGTSTIPTMNDFVNLWRNIATELSVYPNVLFELWNEVAHDQDDWFNACNQTIRAIREVCDNIVLVQWDWDVWYREGEFAGVGTIEWALDPRIQGENILYSTHLYHESRGYYQDPSTGDPTYFYQYDDVLRAFTEEKMWWLLYQQNKPIYVGEYGPYHVGERPPNELTACDNGLTILDAWEINYNIMWWWVGSDFGLYEDRGGSGCDWNSLTEWGAIAKSHLSP